MLVSVVGVLFECSRNHTFSGYISWVTLLPGFGSCTHMWPTGMFHCLVVSHQRAVCRETRTCCIDRGILPHLQRGRMDVSVPCFCCNRFPLPPDNCLFWLLELDLGCSPQRILAQAPVGHSSPGQAAQWYAGSSCRAVSVELGLTRLCGSIRFL